MEYTKIELPADADTFEGPGGQTVIRVEWDRWAYSPDGAAFTTMALSAHVESFAGGVRREHWSYEDPSRGRRGGLYTSQTHADRFDALELDGVEFDRGTTPREIALLPLPAVRSPLWLLRQPASGVLVYVSKDRYRRHPEDEVKLFIGTGEVLRMVPSSLEASWPHRVLRHRTPRGTLDIPYGVHSPDDLAPKRRRMVPTWDGERLDMLMLERFDALETADQVRIIAHPDVMS